VALRSVGCLWTMRHRIDFGTEGLRRFRAPLHPERLNF